MVCSVKNIAITLLFGAFFLGPVTASDSDNDERSPALKTTEEASLNRRSLQAPTLSPPTGASPTSTQPQMSPSAVPSASPSTVLPMPTTDPPSPTLDPPSPTASPAPSECPTDPSVWTSPTPRPAKHSEGRLGPVQPKSAAKLKEPTPPKDPPRVSTRNHFTYYNILLNKDPMLNSPPHTTTSFKVEGGTIPGFKTGIDCPLELVVYVHGIYNTEEIAKGNFRLAKQSFEQVGYHHPVVGYTWDSNPPWKTLKSFDDAVYVARKNGPKLAKFLVEFKCDCPNTKVRLIGHSLGTRVILEALESLDSNEKWSNENFKIESATVLGAAVDNEEVSTDPEEGYGDHIENVVVKFYNKYNRYDNVLGYYFCEERDKALGKHGAQSRVPLPKNYVQRDVWREINRDTDGDGRNDGPLAGFDHSGYSGVTDGSVLVYNGVIDEVVDDWLKQAGVEKTCRVTTTLERVTYFGSYTKGIFWRFVVSFGGEYRHIGPAKELREGNSLTLNEEIMSRKIADAGDRVSLDIKINAFEVEPEFSLDLNEGTKGAEFEFLCDGTTYNFYVEVVNKEGSKKARMFFFFKVSTEVISKRLRADRSFVHHHR